MLRTLSLPAIIFSVICLSLPGRADLHSPNGPVVLTVSLADGSSAEFDQDALGRLPQDEFVTDTIWTEGPQTFRGVRLADFLNEFGVVDGELILFAVNGYSVSLPIAQIEPGGALLATKRNGQEMTLRDKGPLWLVYPYDQDERYRTEQIYSNSIWQLNRMEVKSGS